MSTVGAYIELKPGDTRPDWDYDNIQEGYFYEKTPEGLDVYFTGEETEEGPPDSAQVYLYWEPRVYAVWNDEEGIENGEDREDADGSDVEQRDEEVPAQPDLGAGEGGEGDGDVPAPGAERGSEEVE